MESQKRPVETFICKTLHNNDDDDFDDILAKSLFATPTPPEVRYRCDPSILRSVEDVIDSVAVELKASVPCVHADLVALVALEARIAQALPRLREARDLVHGLLIKLRSG
jgi:hypothetical protein